MSDAQRGRWSEEDLALLRALGGSLSQIILGEDVDVPDLQRRDELGILANMVSRLAHELRTRRRQDLAHARELEHRVEELQAAYTTQEKLLGALRSLPSPILDLYEGILLVPVAGTLDAPRIGSLLPPLRERIAARRPEVVILHLTAGEPLSPELTALLLRGGQSFHNAGARLILAGVPAPHPAGLGLLSPCVSLQEAVLLAFDFVGYRITR